MLGATGLVGRHLLALVADDGAYDSVVILARRQVPAPSAKVTTVVVDFDDATTFREHASVDDVYCCLGTTLKQAGSREAFRRVDLDYPLEIGRAARAAGASRYVIVTAVGADPKSRVFYNRVKGEVEAALGELGFSRGVKILRPSMLLGDREESRPAEHVASTLMRWVAPAFGGPLKRYRAIDASAVARAMHRAGLEESPESRVYEGADLFALADG